MLSSQGQFQKPQQRTCLGVRIVWLCMVISNNVYFNCKNNNMKNLYNKIKNCNDGYKPGITLSILIYRSEYLKNEGGDVE